MTLRTHVHNHGERNCHRLEKTAPKRWFENVLPPNQVIGSSMHAEKTAHLIIGTCGPSPWHPSTQIRPPGTLCIQEVDKILKSLLEYYVKERGSPSPRFDAHGSPSPSEYRNPYAGRAAVANTDRPSLMLSVLGGLPSPPD